MKHVRSIHALLTAMTFLFITLPIQAGTVSGTVTIWEEVYYHDSNGNAISGDFNSLVNAIKTGSDIKIINVTASGHFSIYPQTVAVIDNDNLVYALQENHAVSISNGLPSIARSTKTVGIWRTDGVRSSELYDTNGEFISSSSTTGSFKWFVAK